MSDLHLVVITLRDIPNSFDASVNDLYITPFIIGFIAFIYITIHVTLLINNKQHNNIISDIELEKKHLQIERDSLKTAYIILQEKNIVFYEQLSKKEIIIDGLQKRLKNEQEKNKQLVNSINSWTNEDILHFFTNRYNTNNNK